ncbi:MAG: pilus assembly protein PilP [Deltaproteobacteria bacterium]|nr:pilus assembly protein PilP [Deltaproteobacteria bacterium]MBW2132039.1 pilus assembly protein PilP [Deltaproteobacteria bacterium]
MTLKRKNRGKPRLHHTSFFSAVFFVSALFSAFTLMGCEAKEQTPPKPQVVTKKIVSEKAPAGAASPAESKTAPEPQGPKTATAPEPQRAPGAGPAPKPTNILALLGLIPKGAAVSGGTSYDPKGKIDPFQPLFRQKPETMAQKKRRVRKGPLTPLEKVGLSQLQLTGVILAKSGNKALVKEASGKGYVVKVGTPIGTNFGRIVQILNDRIIVEEEVEDVMGRVTLQKKEMRLQKPPGE